MKTFRKGIFETNSSSTHSLVILTKEEYEKWNKGEILYNPYEQTFIPNEYEDSLSFPDDYFTYEEYADSDYLENTETNYTSPSGDELVIICRYGYEG